jgi:hypothetical protein
MEKFVANKSSERISIIGSIYNILPEKFSVGCDLRLLGSAVEDSNEIRTRKVNLLTTGTSFNISLF